MKSKKTLNSLIRFCEVNPELRFWQAIHAWMKADIIIRKRKGKSYIEHDTFYWKGKNK